MGLYFGILSVFGALCCGVSLLACIGIKLHTNLGNQFYLGSAIKALCEYGEQRPNYLKRLIVTFAQVKGHFTVFVLIF